MSSSSFSLSSSSFLYQKKYDSIVIGAGITGLYTCYRLLKRNENENENERKILLVESSDRIGGRLMQDTFGDVNIPLGGGIIRYPKDKHLIDLIENELQLKLKIIPWKQTPSFIPTMDFDDILLREMPRFLQENNKELANWPFFMFVSKFFNKNESKIREFYDLWGFTDMLFIPTEHVFSSYGIDDILHKNNKFYAVIENGHWDALTSALMNRLRFKIDIHLKEKVLFIDKEKQEIITDKYTYSFTNKCFQTIGISYQENRLVSTPWPFIRIYLNRKDKKEIQLNPNLNLNLNLKKNDKNTRSLVTSTNLQRVIFFTPSTVMASYADGQNALYWRDVLENKKKKQELLEYFGLQEEYEKNQVEIKVKFWPVGVHFFSRLQLKREQLKRDQLKRDQFKRELVIQVGEWKSLNNQGWVEGAIETVDDFFSSSLDN